MANKAMIQRELKRQKLVMKYATKRATLKEQIKQNINGAYASRLSFSSF